ncbi:MAG: hypothetical protein ABJ275_12420 [Maricaulaceae bacterium]
MGKFDLTFCLSGKKGEKYLSYRVATNWDINFYPSEDFTNGLGDNPPNLAKIWTYVEKNLEKFELAKNELSCSLYFSGMSEPIVIWRDPKQHGELLIINSETNKDWWVIG